MKEMRKKKKKKEVSKEEEEEDTVCLCACHLTNILTPKFVSQNSLFNMNVTNTRYF